MSKGLTRRWVYLSVIVLAVYGGAVAALSQLVPENATWVTAPAATVVGAVAAALLTLRASPERDRQSYQKFRIGLVGAPRVGKTLYLITLYTVLQNGASKLVDFEPIRNTEDRLNSTMAELALGRWIARTPSDYLYLFSALISTPRSEPAAKSAGSRRYQLEVADVAGEQLAEFVPGEEQYAAKGSYYQYVLDSDALFLFIDYPAVDPGYGPPAAPLSYQVDNLIFVIQAIADSVSPGGRQLLEVPVCVIITKLDVIERDSAPDSLNASAQGHLPPVGDYLTEKAASLSGVMDELPAILDRFRDQSARDELRRLVTVAAARFKWVGLFTVSAVGSAGEKGRPPSAIAPVNVAAPLEWVLDTRPRQKRSLARS